jgi:archaellum component FlaF (FlaF/FlaG flagellin family)
MGWVEAAVAVVGAIVDANGKQQAANAQKDAYNMQADNILAQGQSDIANLRTKTDSLKSTQQTEMAANGMFSNSASYEDILSDTAYREKLDELTIEDNANRQAAMARKGASNAAAAGSTAVASSLLGSATQIADSWDQWTKTSAVA